MSTPTSGGSGDDQGAAPSRPERKRVMPKGWPQAGDEDPFDFVPTLPRAASRTAEALTEAPEEPLVVGVPPSEQAAGSEHASPAADATDAGTAVVPASEVAAADPTPFEGPSPFPPFYAPQARRRFLSLSGQGGSAAMMVSLALVLLVFFVVLISLSSADRLRKEAVVESLRKTFLLQTQSAPDPRALQSELSLVPTETFQQRITDLLTKEIPSARVRQIRVGEEIQALFPAEVLFPPESGVLRPAREKFFDKLVLALSSPPPGVLFKVEIVVGSDYDSSKIENDIQSLSRSRAAAMAVAMLDHGGPPSAFSIGAVGGKPETVRMTFAASDAMRQNTENTSPEPKGGETQRSGNEARANQGAGVTLGGGGKAK